MNAVVVHDGTIHPGGAVDVVLEAARELDADLVVGFSGPERAWWERRASNDVRLLHRPGRLRLLGDVRNALRMLRLDLSGYDLVVSSGPAAKFYQPVDGQRVIHYMHHPPLGVMWFDGSLVSYALRVLDRIETASVPTVVANSHLTADRLGALYNREADAVVPPPVDVERFATDAETRPGAVVMVGRLEERKRPGIAVEAFAGFDGPVEERPQLHLLGDGPLRDAVESAAPGNVHVHGYVDDDELVRRVGRASAGLFLARREDFGIAPVEYMAAGTPVVGVDEPNTNNQVEDGRTGLLVDPDPDDVRAGVEQALARDWDRSALVDAARAFGRERFREELRAVVD